MLSLSTGTCDGRRVFYSLESKVAASFPLKPQLLAAFLLSAFEVLPLPSFRLT